MTSPDRDILISRVVDGSALDHDWAAMESLAQKDPLLWRELAQSQRQHAALVSLVNEASRIADATDIEIPETHVIGRLSGVARWGGWAAAAAITVAWLGGLRTGVPVTNTADLTRGLGSSQKFDSPADALGAYLELGGQQGTVLGEMPAKVVIRTVPADDGSPRYDVYYLRQIVERARVDDLYRMSNDELGRGAAPVPAHLGARPESGSY